MNNRNFSVGLFVAVAIGLFIGASLWLTGRQGSEPTVHYSMYFEKDVGGLMLGGPVFYLGVNVGNVISMDIIPGNPMRVRVNAEVLKSAPVDAGTYASLAFQGITGVAVIKLSADPGIHGPLQIMDGDLLPAIPVRDAGFSALLAKAPAVVENLDTVLSRINQVLSDENRKYVTDMLSNMSSITNALAAKEETIGELPDLLKQAIEELQSSLEQINSVVGSVQPELSSTLANLEQTSQNLADMTGTLESWALKNDADMNAFMGDGLGQVPDLIKDARSTLREIEKLVKDLREDPSKLIYQPNEKTVEVEH